MLAGAILGKGGHWPLFALALPVVAACCAVGPVWAQDAPTQGVNDWAVAEGLDLAVDTAGYSFPSAIAVVPNPGDAPDDPIYFVTEIRGTLKAVTNDRSVHVVAEGISNLRPVEELPAYAAELGMAGICLDPARGYVFVTYTYVGEDGAVRNNMTRFSTAPGTFATTPTARVDFTDVFVDDIAAISHQIGPCQVVGDALYVSVGNAEDKVAGRQLDTTLGKVLRMTVDGAPYPGNPFIGRGSAGGAGDYVWAYGLRNPFSLKVVNDRVFVADNGPGIDRFLEVRAGEDYKFDGGDWSIGMNADMVFSPAVSPVGMDYQAGSGGLAPVYGDTFYLALTGSIRDLGPSRNGSKSVVAFAYDFARDVLTDVPAKVIEYRGEGAQIVAGVGVAQDGVYVVPMLPDGAGTTAIYRLFPNPKSAFPNRIGDNLDAAGLIDDRNCHGCHRPGGGGTAPNLDPDLLFADVSERLSAPAYRASLSSLEPAERETAEGILALGGHERVRAWVIQQIDTPGFDNPDSAMPDLDLDRAQAALIANHILPPPPGFVRQSLALIQSPGGTLAIGFAAGIVWGVGLAVAVARRRAGGKPPPAP